MRERAQLTHSNRQGGELIARKIELLQAAQIPERLRQAVQRHASEPIAGKDEYFQAGELAERLRQAGELVVFKGLHKGSCDKTQ